MMPFLTICAGPPASGKSFWCQPYKQRNGACVVLSSDEVRGILGASESDQTVSSETFAFLETACEVLLRQGRDVVIDITGTTKRARRPFVNIGLKYGAHIRIVVFSVPLEVCKARNAARERKVPESVIERMFSQWENPQTFAKLDAAGRVSPESGECHSIRYV